MQKLIAVKHILYLSKQYRPGDELPRNDGEMTKAWIAAGTAKLEQDEEIIEGASKKKAKAKPVTATAGLTGDSVPKTSEDDLVGKPPRKK